MYQAVKPLCCLDFHRFHIYLGAMATIHEAVEALGARSGVKAVVILGKDGLPIDSVSSDGSDLETMAAMVPAVVQSFGSLSSASAQGNFGTAVMEFQDGKAVVADFADDALLAIFTDAGTNVGPLLYDVKKHVAAIASLF